jgi:hypothetical protein
VWLEVYRALSKLDRGEYGPWLRVVKMDITQRSATVRVEVDDQAAYDKIRAQFEASEYFRERARNPRVVDIGPRNFVNGHWQQDFEFRFKDED